VRESLKPRIRERVLREVMRPRSWEEWVQDILESIEAARRFTEGMSLATFEADEKTIRAVAYQIIILGEATNHILPEV